MSARHVSPRSASAVDLYQGELLPDTGIQDAPAFEEWLLLRRERLNHQVVTALQNLSTAYATRKEYERAVAYSRRLIALDPYNEAGYRLLMQSLAQIGQTNEALAIFERLESLLEIDLGVQPEPGTRTLFQELHASRQAATIRPSRSPLHGFPAQFTPFWGRKAELRQINDLILDPARRLLTVVGPGGIGKTRLCIEAARELSATGEFPDGIFFLALAAAETRSGADLCAGDRDRRTFAQTARDSAAGAELLCATSACCLYSTTSSTWLPTAKSSLPFWRQRHGSNSCSRHASRSISAPSNRCASRASTTPIRRHAGFLRRGDWRVSAACSSSCRRRDRPCPASLSLPKTRRIFAASATCCKACRSPSRSQVGGSAWPTVPRSPTRSPNRWICSSRRWSIYPTGIAAWRPSLRTPGGC